MSDLSKLEKVKEILESEGENPEVIVDSDYNIPELKLEFSKRICSFDITIEGKNIAWCESINGDAFLLRVIQNGNDFRWKPKSRNGDDMCVPLLLEWYENHLLFIYLDEHGIFVTSVKDGIVNDVFIHGCDLARNGNMLAYDTYTNRLRDHVKILELPSLKSLRPISIYKAKRDGLVPKEVMQPGAADLAFKKE